MCLCRAPWLQQHDDIGPSAGAGSSIIETITLGKNFQFRKCISGCHSSVTSVAMDVCEVSNTHKEVGGSFGPTQSARNRAESSATGVAQ